MKIAGLSLAIFALLAINGRKDIMEDPICTWVHRPDTRNSDQPLALVEIVSLSNERHTFAYALNSKVSDDGGKTWYNLQDVLSGRASLKIIEAPGASLPQNLTVDFMRAQYVHNRDTPWTDKLVQPGARLLAFFSKENGQWVLWSSDFIDPVSYLVEPRFARELQADFHTPLAENKAVEERKRELEQADLKIRPQAGQK